MSKSVDPTNCSAFQYNENTAGIIAKLCEPLSTNFGITTFVYSHFLNDGTYLDLCTDRKWQQRYLECYASQGFINDYIRNIYQNRTRYTLWNNDVSLPRDKIFTQFIVDSCEFDIWHGFSMYKHHKDSMEAWHFATTKENYKLINFYLNHLDLLDRFIFYFQDKAASLIDISDINKLVVLKNRTPLKESEDSSFIGEGSMEEYLLQTSFNRYCFNTPQGKVCLTRREVECIFCLSSSKTVKETASFLKLSPRTVESYVESAKRKLGCWTRSQLVETFIHYNGRSLEPYLISNTARRTSIC